MTDEQRKQQFLVELAELTRKHGISIGGCGWEQSRFVTNPEFRGFSLPHGI